MFKNYVVILFVLILNSFGFAQERKSDYKPVSMSQKSEQLNFYPNPVSNGKIFISSSTTSNRLIEIYDVLGKSVFSVHSSSKEINISSLLPGVYIIKLKENETILTRKLVVR